MTGPTKDILANTYTWFTIFGITIPYLTIVAPVLFIKNIILPIINGILFITTVSFLLLTSFTDPGIIPRKYILELDGEIPLKLQVPTKLNNININN